MGCTFTPVQRLYPRVSGAKTTCLLSWLWVRSLMLNRQLLYIYEITASTPSTGLSPKRSETRGGGNRGIQSATGQSVDGGNTKHCASLCLDPSRVAIYTRCIAHVRPERHSTVRAWVAGDAILVRDPTSNPCRRGVEIGNSLSGCDGCVQNW